MPPEPELAAELGAERLHGQGGPKAIARDAERPLRLEGRVRTISVQSPYGLNREETI